MKCNKSKYTDVGLNMYFKLVLNYIYKLMCILKLHTAHTNPH